MITTHVYVCVCAKKRKKSVFPPQRKPESADGFKITKQHSWGVLSNYPVVVVLNYYSTITYIHTMVKKTLNYYSIITLEVIGLPQRETKSVRIDPEVWSQFVSWVDDVEGQKYGELGRHVENALNEYIDNDRAARIEERLSELAESLSEENGTHTHTGSKTVERTRRIVDRVLAKHDNPIKSEYIENAIVEIAGGDDRTIEKYKGIMKKRDMLFKHPFQPVWTDDKQQFAKWWDGNGADMQQFNEDYGMDPSEIDQILEAKP